MPDAQNDDAGAHSLDDILYALSGWHEVEQTLLEWQEAREQRPQWGDQRLPEELLLRAIRHPEEPFRQIAAVAGSWSTEVMELAITDRDTEVRTVAARSVRTPPDALAIAATDHDDDVRLAAASNPSTPVPALLGLLRDPHAGVVLAAVRQYRLPCRVMSRLAASDDPSMMIAVAAAPQTSTAALHRLASRSSAPGLWTALAGNPHTENRTLQLIPTTPRPHLHQLLIKHPLATDELCRRLARAYLDEPEAPLRLAGLALMFRGRVRVAPWGSGRTDAPPARFERPSDVLSWLAKGADLSTVLPYALDVDSPAWVRMFILSRAELDQATWARLATDHEPRIGDLALRRSRA